MRSKIIGRCDEISQLDQCMERDSSQLIIVYGRRRVGKTFLINEYFDNNFAFKITGAYKKTSRFQLEGFREELMRKTGKDYDVPSNWREAFRYLRDYIESLPSGEKKVVFFDEMPWLDTARSDFLPVFEWFWNDWASTVDDLVLIVCGSATSWMTDKLSGNKGGLFNRQSCRIYLKPFNLKETEMLLKNKGIEWSRFDITECYMILGGIPYYLNLLDKRYSCAQNVDALLFKDKGALWDEFGHLYNTLFTNSEKYIKIVEVLSRKRSGFTRKEISELAKIPSNGTLTKMLNNLVSSGFVRVTNMFGNKKRDTYYELSDYYTCFYFHFIKDNYGKDEHYWSNAIDNPARRAWSGITFEQVCKDHIEQIKTKLGISGVLSEQSTWNTKGDPDLGIPGAQIDLLIDRRDRVINVCEIKYSINEYIIDKEYDLTLRNKIDSFRRVTGSKKTIQLIMITTYGLKKGKYSGIVQKEILLDDLFL